MPPPVLLATQQQRAVAGATGGLLFLAAFVLWGYALWPTEPPYGTTPADRVVLALSWQGVAFVPLLIATLVYAGLRFRVGAFNPLAAPHPALAFPAWYVHSTAHHTLLLLVGHVAFAITAKPVALPLIPLLVIVYVVGRVALWAGGPGRTASVAFAFTTSVLPTAALLLYAAWHVVYLYAVALGFIRLY